MCVRGMYLHHIYFSYFFVLSIYSAWQFFFSPPPSLSDSTGYNPKDFNASVMVNPAYF